MAKRGALEHPKTLDLAESLGIMDCFALGIVEAFWHHVAKYHEDGDITGLKPGILARSIRYTGDAMALIEAMIGAGFIDRDGERLLVHGWAEHADDATHSRLFRAVKQFADGTIPKARSVSPQEKAGLDVRWAALLGSKPSDNVRQTSGKRPTDSLPEPEPEPEPEPMVRDALDSYLTHRRENGQKAYTPQSLLTLKRKLIHLPPRYAVVILEAAVVRGWQGIPPALLPSVYGSPPSEWMKGHEPPPLRIVKPDRKAQHVDDEGYAIV